MGGTVPGHEWDRVIFGESSIKRRKTSMLQGVGGVADHVHLLVGLKAMQCLADVVRELKKASSVWVHEQIGEQAFAWQEGYAAFTVSATSREAVQRYIAYQEEHHRVKSYGEEMIEMFQRAGIQYDPQHVV